MSNKLTDEDHDRVHGLYRALDESFHEVLNGVLAKEKPEVDELVRTMLHEQFRFWKRTV